MKPVDLRTERIHVRQFNDEDLDACLQFRHQVLGGNESLEDVAAWLKWTIDSYRELESLGQPPYADYAVQLERDRLNTLVRSALCRRSFPGALWLVTEATICSVRKSVYSGAYCQNFDDAGLPAKQLARS